VCRTKHTSIGRVIRKLKDVGKLRGGVKHKLNGKSGKLIKTKAKHKEKERCKKYNPQKPGDLIQADSAHLNIEGKKRYLTNAIDLSGRMAFSYEYERLKAKMRKISLREQNNTFRLR
jgi:hypothetical protein